MAYGNGGSYGEATTTSYADAPQAIKREPMVQRESNRLEKNIESVHMAISELAERLSLVLTPESPQTSGPRDSAGVPIPSVPLAQFMATNADRANMACQRLQALIARVEV